jgi:hypothetical protein
MEREKKAEAGKAGRKKIESGEKKVMINKKMKRSKKEKGKREK